MHLPQPRQLTRLALTLVGIPFIAVLIAWASIRIIPGCGFNSDAGIPVCMVGGTNIAESLDWLAVGGLTFTAALGVFASLPMLLLAAGITMWRQFRGKTGT